MIKLLIQNVNSVEVRTSLHAAMLDDALLVKRCDLSEVTSQEGGCVPIGSVEFVRRYANSVGIRIPVWETYPGCLSSVLHRKIELIKKQDIDLNLMVGKFIKPKFTKLFTGFVVGDTDDDNLKDFVNVSDDADVYVSDCVNFVSEVRYYIDHGIVVGYARYDQSEENAVPLPDIAVVRDCAAQMISHICTLDFGVLDDGTTALVESNDFWSIGLYDKCVSSDKYVTLLIKRWQEIELLNITN